MASSPLFAAGHFARIGWTFVLAGMLGAPAAAAAPPSATPVPMSLDAARAAAADGNDDALRSYVAGHPADRDARRLLGDYEVGARRYAEAETTYKSLIASGAGDKETHDRLGRLYTLQNRIDDAIAEFERSLPDVTAYADLVRLHRRNGDLDAFVAGYRDRANGSPNDAAAQFGYGVVLRELRDPAHALGYLEIAERLAPRSCPALTEVGNAQLDLDRRVDARASFEACLRIERNDYSALVDDAVTFMDDAPARSLSLLNRAAALRPNEPVAYVDLGYLADAAGRPDEAQTLYRRAIALDPFFRDAYVNLGYNYFTGGRMQLAEETFLRGLSVSRDDGRIEYLLGKTLERRGQAVLAARAYRTATESDEPDVAAAARSELAAESIRH